MINVVPPRLSYGVLDFDADKATGSRSLASTLEKLYIWERKLYHEVKACFCIIIIIIIFTSMFVRLVCLISDSCIKNSCFGMHVIPINSCYFILQLRIPCFSFFHFQLEEKMRLLLRRRHKQLRCLVDNGAEAHKVDSMRTAIKKLSAKMRIALQVVHSISKKINRLRDEELQPRTTELVRGYANLYGLKNFHSR